MFQNFGTSVSLCSRALFNFYSIMDNTYSPVVYSYNARPLHFAPPRRCTLFGLLLFITGEIPRIVFPKNTATNHRATPALSLSLSLNFSSSHPLSHSLPVFRAPPFLLPPPIRSIVSQKPGIARSRSILLDSFVAFSTSQSPTILLNRDIFSPRSSFQANNPPALHSSISSSFSLFRLFIFPLSRLFRSSCLISSRLSNNIIIIMHREQAFNSEATAKKACG